MWEEKLTDGLGRLVFVISEEAERGPSDYSDRIVHARGR
jgi:hypothetical protein